MVLTVRNTQDRGQTLELGAGPHFIAVTTPDCQQVWFHPRNVLLVGSSAHFGPHEEKRLVRTWSLTDDRGEMVSPGYYYVYVILKVDGDPADGGEFTSAELVVSETVWVSEGQLRAAAARLMHPPTRAHPCISGTGLVYETYVRQVMERRSDVLKEWRWAWEIVDADMLDENRMSTGRRGIRVITGRLEEMAEDSPLRGLLKCLDGVPVQVVVWPGEY